MPTYTKEDAVQFVRRWIRITEATVSGPSAGGSMAGLAGGKFTVPLGAMLRRVFPRYKTGYAKDPRGKKKSQDEGAGASHYSDVDPKAKDTKDPSKPGSENYAVMPIGPLGKLVRKLQKKYSLKNDT